MVQPIWLEGSMAVKQRFNENIHLLFQFVRPLARRDNVEADLVSDTLRCPVEIDHVLSEADGLTVLIIPTGRMRDVDKSCGLSRRHARPSQLGLLLVVRQIRGFTRGEGKEAGKGHTK